MIDRFQIIWIKFHSLNLWLQSISLRASLSEDSTLQTSVPPSSSALRWSLCFNVIFIINIVNWLLDRFQIIWIKFHSLNLWLQSRSLRASSTEDSTLQTSVPPFSSALRLSLCYDFIVIINLIVRQISDHKNKIPFSESLASIKILESIIDGELNPTDICTTLFLCP